LTINYLALFGATLAAFVFGGLWYGPLFSKTWVASLGKSEAQLKAGARPMPLLFAITLVASFVMAWVLAGLMLHLAKAGVPATLRNGLITGFFCWLGFVATTLVTNHGYQGARWTQTLIDGGHWLGVLLIEGAILGAFAIR
jgi:hypothetical protein